MMQIFRRSLLPATVCITGACVLVIEVVAVRILAPFFGSTITTVSSVLSVILLALSCGYALGGRLADRYPHLRAMYSIIFCGGVATLLCYGIGSVILPSLSTTFGVGEGALIAAVCVFFLPAFLLGMLSPYAVVLHAQYAGETDRIGTASGTIFFWSTLGSIAGSVLTGFVFIPHFGIQVIMLSCGGVLCVLGILPYVAHRAFGVVLFCLASTLGLLLFSWSASSALSAQALYSRDGVYEHIYIFDQEYLGRPTRFLQQEFNASAAQFLDTDDPHDLAFDYTQYYELYELFVAQPQRFLALGGGAYSVPKVLAAKHPEAQIDVVEIEPTLYPLAQQYFGLREQQNLRNHVDDCRRFLRVSDEQYDVIFSDVYHSVYAIPTHCATQEFFALAQAHLKSDGVFIANVVGRLAPSETSFLLSEMRTFASVFPQHIYLAVTDPQEADQVQNIIFVGWNGERPREQLLDLESELIAQHANERIRNIADAVIDESALNIESHILLTDDYAPVEYLLAHDLKR